MVTARAGQPLPFDDLLEAGGDGIDHPRVRKGALQHDDARTVFPDLRPFRHQGVAQGCGASVAFDGQPLAQRGAVVHRHVVLQVGGERAVGGVGALCLHAQQVVEVRVGGAEQGHGVSCRGGSVNLTSLGRTPVRGVPETPQKHLSDYPHRP
jgi:hypothetical protein